MSSTLAELRSLVPPRRGLTIHEAEQITERQATRLLALTGITGPPVPSAVIADLPRIYVARETVLPDSGLPIPASGSSHWNGQKWVIVVNGDEPRTRQRFSLAHEFKHVMDHPFRTQLYPRCRGYLPEERWEHIAHYFAASLLMPRQWIKRVWASERMQDVADLAQLFEVSQTAMEIRLLKLGLLEPGLRWIARTKEHA